MTTAEYNRAKFMVSDACNQTGLAPAEIVGVLSAVLAEARELMCFELAGELMETQDKLSKLTKEVDDGSTQRHSDAEGSRSGLRPV